MRASPSTTKDIDLGLRDEIVDGEGLRDRLIEALADDVEGDGFTFSTLRSQPMAQDGGGHLTWRVAVETRLAGRQFAAVKVDVSPRAHELEATETLALPNSLAFAGLSTPDVEVIDVHRHGAEKLHAMVKDFGNRENSRVRDLVDLMLLAGHGLVHIGALGQAVREVWTERDGVPPPQSLPSLPAAWRLPYERMADEHGVERHRSPWRSRARASCGPRCSRPRRPELPWPGSRGPSPSHRRPSLPPSSRRRATTCARMPASTGTSTGFRSSHGSCSSRPSTPWSRTVR